MNQNDEKVCLILTPIDIATEISSPTLPDKMIQLIIRVWSPSDVRTFLDSESENQSRATTIKDILDTPRTNRLLQILNWDIDDLSFKNSYLIMVFGSQRNLKRNNV